MRFVASITIALFASSCSRARTHYARSGIAEQVHRIADGVSIAPAEPDAHEDTLALPVTYGEASRRTVQGLDGDASWAKELDLLREHFHDSAKLRLEIQTLPLAGNRRAVLLSQADTWADPIIVVVDREGTLMWQKNRPLAGTLAGARNLALAPGPRGGISLFWFDPTTRIVAVRMWDGQGSVFADYQLLDLEACDGLSGIAWRGFGWLAVGSDRGALRAQLLREDGRLGWPRAGMGVGAQLGAASPTTVVLDTDESFMIFQPDAPTKRVLVSRYDTRAAPAWSQPVAIAAPALRAQDRVVATRPNAGTVHVTAPTSVDVTSGGTLR